MAIEKVTTNPVKAKDYKAENAEIKRASQYELDLYSLMKRIERHDPSAIIQAKNLKSLNFSPETEFAAKLMQEAQEYTEKINDLCYDSSGELSNYSIQVAKETISQDSYNDMTDTERAEAYNDLISDMELGS